jgi:hypothetical protein
MKVYLRGGVGDFLQCLPAAMSKPSEEYYIHTHYSKSKEFFNEFGIENAKIFLFNDAKEHDEQIDLILSDCNPRVKTNFTECSRVLYSQFQFSKEINDEVHFHINFSNNNPIIGIHPFGSKFSKDIYSKFNLPIKFIPSDVVNSIISNDTEKKYNYLIFGSDKDFIGYDVQVSENVRNVCFENILSSLACVPRCKKFLGTDSCFKTMSSMNSIPTYCLVGNFDDQTRDAYFIDQYVEDGVMKIFKFNNIDNQKNEIIKFFLDAINE